nr:hypothetical protein K-LCC10_0067 [Kaumoebavirus]
MNLPAELYYEIFSYLEPLDIFQWSRTSRVMQNDPVILGFLRDAGILEWKIFSSQFLTPRETYFYWQKIRWNNYIENNEMSEALMEELARRFSLGPYNWLRISQYQTLSERFIAKYSDQVHWGSISEYQNISGPFVIAWKKRIDFKRLLKNKYLGYQAAFKLTYDTELEEANERYRIRYANN